MSLEAVEEGLDVLDGEETVDIVHICHYEWEASSIIVVHVAVCCAGVNLAKHISFYFPKNVS